MARHHHTDQWDRQAGGTLFSSLQDTSAIGATGKAVAAEAAIKERFVVPDSVFSGGDMEDEYCIRRGCVHL
jgi:hypothetical protein